MRVSPRGLRTAVIVACATGALLATPAAHAAYEIARGTTAGVPVYTTPNGAIEQMLDRASGNSEIGRAHV